MRRNALLLLLAGLLLLTAGCVKQENNAPSAEDPPPVREEDQVPAQDNTEPEASLPDNTPKDDLYLFSWRRQTVDGSLSMEEAAARLAEQAAEDLRTIPDEVSWKPLDIQVKGTSVSDAYLGEGENFCCGTGFYVLLPENLSPQDMSRWEAGAGLIGPVEDGAFAGYYEWGGGTSVHRDQDGNWRTNGIATGGEFVRLPHDLGFATADQLLEMFFLTRGTTRNWVLPERILQMPGEKLTALPEALAQRTEDEIAVFREELLAFQENHPGNSRLTKPELTELLDSVVEYDYDLMQELTAQVWTAAVDGALSMEEAALLLAEQVAEGYRTLPDWVAWKPLDMQVSVSEVFDAYYGDPTQFCCTMDFLVHLTEEPDEEAQVSTPAVGYWNTGAGLASKGDGDFADYWFWGAEVLVCQNEDSDWYCGDHGTGGYSVYLPGYTLSYGMSNYLGYAPLEVLVEFYFQTNGQTHDWLLPHLMCEKSPEDLAELNGLLAQRTDEEAEELMRNLAQVIAEHHYDSMVTLEELQDLLDEKYHPYLDLT